MDNPFSNIDQGFKDAFEHWEADHTPSEMHAQWKQVSQKLPANTPHSGQPAQHLLHGSKIFGVAGIGAAVTTVGILLYNIYVKPTDNSSRKDKIVTVQNEPNVNTGNNANNAVPFQGNLHKGENEGRLNNKPTTTNGGNTSNGATSNVGTNNSNDNQPANNGLNPGTNPNQKVNPVQTGNNLNIDLSTRNNNNAIVSKPRFIFSDTVICIGSGLSLRSANLNSNSSVVDWGEGNSTPYYDNIWHVYTSPGLYHVKVTNNLVTEDKAIQVLGMPKASFTSNMKEDLLCEFSSQAENASNVIWYFGDGSLPDHGNYVRHRYSESGDYTVKMVANNGASCADTSISLVKARKLKEPIVPNIITPNGDVINDSLEISIDNEVYYELIINDKQGKQVFYSKDKNQHWDGTIGNNGILCPQGTYSFKLFYKLQGQNAVKEKIGNITLMR